MLLSRHILYLFSMPNSCILLDLTLRLVNRIYRMWLENSTMDGVCGAWHAHSSELPVFIASPVRLVFSVLFCPFHWYPVGNNDSALVRKTDNAYLYPRPCIFLKEATRLHETRITYPGIVPSDEEVFILNLAHLTCSEPNTPSNIAVQKLV